MKLYSLLIISISFSAILSNNLVASKGVRYQVSVPNGNPDLVNVTLTYTPRHKELHLGSGANQFSNRWGKFIENISAKDKSGVLPIKAEEDTWLFEREPKGEVTLQYQVLLTHADYEWSSGIDGAAYKNDNGIFFSGRALFIIPTQLDESIEISYKLPQSWKIACSWENIPQKNNTFLANNFTELVESVMFLGKYEALIVKRETFELNFILGSQNLIAKKEEYKALAEGVLDYYIDVMQGIPNPSPSNKFTKSVVVLNEDKKTDGEVLGNHISILINLDGDPMSKAIANFIFAHEFFHLWNGKSFSPSNDNCEWFKEGFTNFYTLKALKHVGILNETAFFNVLNDLFYQRYISDNGLGEISLSNGDAKHDHWGLIYGGGLFVAIAQDILIRQHTNNRKSLDDLMQHLYKKLGGTNDFYTLDDLQNKLSELSQNNQDDFFKFYIEGTEKLPVENYLTQSGLNAKIENGKLIISKNEEANELQKAILNGVLGQLAHE